MLVPPREQTQLINPEKSLALLAQAQVIAQNEMVLRAIPEQQIAVVERLRDPTEIALTKRDNGLKLMKARSKQARRAEKEITRLLPKVLEKYRDRLGPDPYCGSTFDFVPLDLKVLLEEPDPLEEQHARDLARMQQRDEYQALEAAIPDLIRLERFERRIWSRQQRAIREFLNISSPSCSLAMGPMTRSSSGSTASKIYMCMNGERQPLIADWQNEPRLPECFQGAYGLCFEFIKLSARKFGNARGAYTPLAPSEPPTKAAMLDRSGPIRLAAKALCADRWNAF